MRPRRMLTHADPCRSLAEGLMPSKSEKLSPLDAEAELRLAESQMSTILAIAADAIISLNENMRIMVFNEGAASIFGYSKEEIIGQPLDVLIPQRYRGGHHAHIASFAGAPVAARRMGER